MVMRRRTGVADGRQFDSGRDEKRAPDEADDKRRQDMHQALGLGRLLLGPRQIGHRGKEQHGRDACPDRCLGKGDIHRVEIDEHRRRHQRIGSGQDHHREQLARPDHQNKDEDQQSQQKQICQGNSHQRLPPAFLAGAFLPAAFLARAFLAAAFPGAFPAARAFGPAWPAPDLPPVRSSSRIGFRPAR